MSKEIAQNGKNIPSNNGAPLIDRSTLEDSFGDYKAPGAPKQLDSIKSTTIDRPHPRAIPVGPPSSGGDSSLTSLENFLLTPDKLSTGGSIPWKYSEVTSNRYDNFMPGDYNNEDAYAQGQGWGSKMINGVGKGLVLTGTTFLQSTVGLVNGIARAIGDGRAASFYDNDFNRNIDEINRAAEDIAPNYYKDVEKNASWYSPDYFLTSNFLWDGIVKNMGFMAGAALSGNAYAATLRALPLASRLFSVGKAAETLAATEESLVAANRAAASFGKIKNLSDKFLSQYNVLNPGGRALVAGISTTGEAGFEAYQNLNDFRNQKIEEYKKANNGLAPTGSDLQKINQAADSVGNASFLANVALLTATNYIQFPKILGSSYTAEKGMINDLSHSINDIVKVDGKWVAKETRNKFVDTFNKVRPYLFSSAEGFEEGAQYAIGMGAKSYYGKKYNNEPTSFLDSTLTGIGETLGTDEGMKNVVIGGLSGAMATAKGNYTESKERSSNTTAAIESFNKFNLSQFTKETKDSINRGTSLQQEREDLLKKGDISGSKDIETDYMINYLTPRIKYGRYDLVTADINEYRTLASTDEGFAQLVQEGKALATDNKENYINRLNSFAQMADNIKSLHQSLSLRYSSVRDEKGESVYTPSVMNQMIYSASKVADYDKRIPQLSTKLMGTQVDTNKIVQDIIDGKDDSFNEAKSSIESNPLLNEDQKADLILALDDIGLMAIKRNFYLKEYDNIKKFPEKYQTESTDAQTESSGAQASTTNKENKQTITVNTKKGEKNLEIGTEYFVGKAVDYSNKGHEVFRAPRVTIIAKNEDGTIKVKDFNGVIHDLKPSILEKFSLGKVSSTLSNKKAKYFMEHWNTIYEYKLKGGKRLTGRLEYEEVAEGDDRLYFVYKSPKGEIKRIEVTGNQFVANTKKGFKEPIIKAVGELTAAQKKAEEDYTSEKDRRLEKKLERRSAVLNDLMNDVVAKQEKTNKLISSKTNALEKIQKEIVDITEQVESNKDPKDKRFKEFRFKSQVSKAIEFVNSLSRMEQTLITELEELEGVKQDIEADATYLSSLIDDIEELPDSTKEFIEELNNELIDLEILVKDTGKQINIVGSMLRSTQNAIQAAVKYLENLIKQFETKYPNIPTIVGKRFYDANTNTVLGEELNKVLESVENIETETIKPNTTRLEDLQEHLDILQGALKDYDSQIRVRENLLNRLEEIQKEYEVKKEETIQMQENEQLKKDFLGVLTNSVKNFFSTKSYEPVSKKSELSVVSSTRPAKDFIPHQARVNYFGNKFTNMPNKNDIKAVIVNSITEADIIPGLTNDFLSDMPTETEAQKALKEKAEKEIIYMIMVDQKGKPVDQDGNTITDDTKLINNAIYQVFPSGSLTGEYNGVTETMFRETVSKEDREFLTTKYNEWRKEQLARTSVSEAYNFSVSMGHPKLVTTKDVSGKDVVDTGARTSAVQAGLINTIALRTEPVIDIATTNESISYGSTTFSTPKGRVFLRIPNVGLAKLFNRKFSKDEASVMFDVMLQIAKNAQIDGRVTERSKELFNWLKSVSYWGIPKKDAGYNSIWFDSVADEGKFVQKLFMSGINKNPAKTFDFTPSGLLKNKDQIIMLLQEMYNNTDSKMVMSDSWNKEYNQIVGIDSEGSPIYVTWKNYQTYLLSDKAPDSEGKLTIERKGKEIPLTTMFKPVTETQPVNREGIYFTLSTMSMFYEKPEPIVVENTPVVKENVAPVKTSAASEFVFDGKTKNTITTSSPRFGGVPRRINFVVSEDGEVTLWGDIGKNKDKDLDDIIDYLFEHTSYNVPQGKELLIKSIKSKLFAVQEQPKAVEKEAPKSIVFDGVTPNVKISDTFGKLVYTVNKEGVVTLDKEKSNDALVSIAQAKKFEIGKAYTVAKTVIEKEIASQVIPKEAPLEDVPFVEETPEATETEKVEENGGEVIWASMDDINHNWDAPLSDEYKDNSLYRAVNLLPITNITTENWKDVEDFIKKTLPNIPLYRVKNIIQATNGKQAWGMVHKGAIYLYENAEVGTAYHEVFEAVWKMFAGPKDKQRIIDEFRNREGSYIDRFTGKSIEYKNASPEQLKEELAEEFRDFILNNKKPKSLIGQLFQDIVNFIKEFFLGPNAMSNTNELFKRIGDGYYAQYNPFEKKLSYATKGIIDIDSVIGDEMGEYRLKPQYINAQQIHEIVQEMTYLTISKLTRNNKSIFGVEKLNKSHLYESLKRDILEGTIKKYKIQLEEDKTKTKEQIAPIINNLGDLYNKIQLDWDAIVERHQEQLKSYSIEFDENDDVLVNDEDNSGKSDYQDARKIDSFRKANSTIKLLLATIPTVKKVGDKIVPNITAIGSKILLPADQAFITLMNALHDSVDVNQMFERLKNLAKDIPSYEVLYRRLTGSEINQPINFSKLEEHDLQLIAAFWSAFKRQNPDVVTVHILPSGEVVIGDSVLSGASRQNKREMLNNIVDTIKSGKSKYMIYESKKGKFYPTMTVKNLVFRSDEIKQYTDFLLGLGIDLNPLLLLTKLNPNQLKEFKSSVEGIRKGISSAQEISSITSKTLDIDGSLLKLGTFKAILENTDFESTYFNINGERTQSFVGTNIVSNLYDTLSKLSRIDELADTPFNYLLTDVFTKNSSAMLAKMFDISEEDSIGSRILGTNDLMKPVFIDGTVDQVSGKSKESSKLSAKERFIQELNLNLGGIYSNLVPGDAAIEHSIRMYYGQEDAFVTTGSLESGSFMNIFKNYFISEVELAKDGRKVAKGKKSTDLRFFKEILGETLHNKIMVDSKKISSNELYDKYNTAITKAVKDFIQTEAEETELTLKRFGAIENTEEGIKIPGFALTNKVGFTQEGLMKELAVLSANYMISNIELHKLVYSDPYQYKDELKRIKNFNSPRQPMMYGSKEINASLNQRYNKGYEETDLGFTDMTKDHFVSSVISDVLSVSDLPDYSDPYEETDGGGLITLKGLRVFLIRTGQWNDAKERQYRYDIAYEKTVKGIELTEAEKEFNIHLNDKGKFVGNNPKVKALYTTIKPIVSGSKNDGNNYNDIVLDKFALMPLSFRILHELNPSSNALKHYEKMSKEKVDYTVYETGRKVGAGAISPIYNQDGSYNTDSFLEKNNIPFGIMGLQTEVPSKDTPLVTQGSQITKLATMDFLEAGVPIDLVIKDGMGKEITDFNKRFAFWNSLIDESKREALSPLYKEIKNNERLLNAKTEQGYEELLNKLGLQNTLEGFVIAYKEKLVKTLKDEITKREVSDNIHDALDGFKKGDVILEATPAFQQIRNILYSIADKNVARPKISGGMKVQVSSALLESLRAHSKEYKDSEGNIKTVYESDILDFYKDEDGKRVCEIMVGRWFKSDKTDQELLDEWYDTDESGNKTLTPEGKKVLSGVAFRIPTQKQNSIDSFVIKQFLPKEFGDNVVVPSALVKKVGSDFDIDKLSIYFKNTFTDLEGKLKSVPFFGYGKQAKDKFAEMFDNIRVKEGEIITDNINSKEKLRKLFSDIALGQTSDSINKKWIPRFRDMFIHLENENGLIDVQDVEQKFIDKLDNLGKRFDELNNEDLQSILKEKFVESYYKASLENEYIESLERLVSHELNFASLIKPNSAEELKNLAKEINELSGVTEIDYSSVGNMLKRTFMSSLRQAFVSGKYAIGIAATAQTNHAQNQRGLMYIDTRKLSNINETDAEILGNKSDSVLFSKDSQINFQNYNKIEVDGEYRPTLSMVKDASGKYISDTIGMFIDGYVDISKGPWIMELGATPNVAGTWLFLSKIGVPIDTIAYFINQPIIRDYLRTLENNGYSWLFNSSILENLLEEYTPQSITEIGGIPSNSELKEMVKLNRKDLKHKMSNLQKSQQQYMLKEFLKYAKMAEHLFLVTQGSNFDTATINDPNLLLKKKIQLEKARNTVISSVDDLLNNSFVGPLKNIMYDIRNAFSEILISDKDKTREVIENVLRPHAMLSDREFVKMSQKVVTDLFDWAVQNNSDLNSKVSKLLLGSSTQKSAAQDIIHYKDSILGNKAKGLAPQPHHPLYNNIILKSLKMEAGNKEGKVNNLYISGRDNKVYDQNLIIYGFNELKKALGAEGKDLYNKFVNLAVVQSGITPSPISFTNLLPYEDFKEIYNDTLTNLGNIPNLADFHKLSVMERTNWNNTSIVPYKGGNMKMGKNSMLGSSNLYDPNQHFTHKSLKEAMNKKQIPFVVSISPYTKEGRSDFMTYSYEDPIPYGERVARLKAGDRSFMHKVLLQKVYYTDENGDRKPLFEIQKNNKTGKEYTKHVFKAINAWGDSFRAKEMYDFPRQSVLDNGYDKIQNEVEDSVITNILMNNVPHPLVSPNISLVKPDGISQEEWDSISLEEKIKINQC